MQKMVIKRDGRIEKFNEVKIHRAILKAYKANYVVLRRKEMDEIQEIFERVEKEVEKLSCPNIEMIQDIVEKEIMNVNKDIAKAYILYRNQRDIERRQRSKFIDDVHKKISGQNNERANANVDEDTFSGKEKESSALVFKEVALLKDLEPEVAQAHRDMLVYQHDLDSASSGKHNCSNIDFQRLFKGFWLKNTDIRPPKSYSTACQLYAVVFQLQSQNQFGGCASCHIDYDLAPYVKKSFAKHFKDGLRWVENLPLNFIENIEDSIDIDSEFARFYDKAYNYAIAMLEKEGKQATEALYHNLNSLESRQGSQLPFTSINFGRDTSAEGRLVNKWLLNASIDGIGKYHRTSIFPISIFQYKKGVNANETDPNYDLKQLALKSLSKRIYPNFVNCDWSQAHEQEGDIDTMFATMGCRTFVGEDINGLGYRRVGRGNAIPNTIILPQLGLMYGICTGERTKPDLDGFWRGLDNALAICEKGLLNRYDIISHQNVKSAPFMYKNGSVVETDKCEETVEETMKHFSLAVGYIGIAEMCQALFGENHVHSKEARDFALEVVKYMYDFCKRKTVEHHLNFALYATPAENLCYTAMKKLKEQWGIIPKVTEKDYLTNSHHVPVWEKVSIYDKLQIEAPFCKYPTGGCITYVELESTFMNNLKAIEDIIDYAFSLDIPYLAINFPIDTCLDCGTSGEFNKRVCPSCDSINVEMLRRITGYLSTDYSYFNEGKQQEVKDRVKHSSYTTYIEEK